MMNLDRKPRTTRLLMALPIAALAFSLAACGGASRPTADQVATGLTEFFDEQGMGDVVDKEAATCFAEKLVDSELSNETLNYLANGEDKQSSVEDRDLTTKILEDNLDVCIKA
jgi:hypothetical protein